MHTYIHSGHIKGCKLSDLGSVLSQSAGLDWYNSPCCSGIWLTGEWRYARSVSECYSCLVPCLCVSRVQPGALSPDMAWNGCILTRRSPVNSVFLYKHRLKAGQLWVNTMSRVHTHTTHTQTYRQTHALKRHCVKVQYNLAFLISLFSLQNDYTSITALKKKTSGLNYTKGDQQELWKT